MPAQAQPQTQDRASQRQSEHTDQANRDAAVADETSPAAHPRTRSADTATTPGLSYGPVLAPRGAQGRDALPAPPRKDPAEVHDEADTLARPATPPAQPQPKQKPLARRREAWQPEAPMAPRPLRPADGATAGVALPVPVPAPAPQPIVPGSSAVNCGGGVCTTPAGGTVNLGTGNAGVNSSGRLCARSGSTVQCF